MGITGTEEIFGFIAGIIAFLAYAIYIFSIYKKQTTPNTFTWLVLATLGLLMTTTYFLQNPGETIWISYSYTMGSIIIFLLSIKYGEKKIGKIEIFSTLAIVATLLIWFITKSSFIALICAVIIDFFGLLPTIKKCYLRPKSENKLSWQLSFLATVINIIALKNWNLEVSLYPIYLVGIDGLIAIILTLRQINQPNHYH